MLCKNTLSSFFRSFDSCLKLTVLIEIKQGQSICSPTKLSDQYTEVITFCGLFTALGRRRQTILVLNLPEENLYFFTCHIHSFFPYFESVKNCTFPKLCCIEFHIMLRLAQLFFIGDIHWNMLCLNLCIQLCVRFMWNVKLQEQHNNTSCQNVAYQK